LFRLETTSVWKNGIIFAAFVLIFRSFLDYEQNCEKRILSSPVCAYLSLSPCIKHLSYEWKYFHSVQKMIPISTWNVKCQLLWTHTEQNVTSLMLTHIYFRIFIRAVFLKFVSFTQNIQQNLSYP